MKLIESMSEYLEVKLRLHGIVQKRSPEGKDLHISLLSFRRKHEFYEAGDRVILLGRKHPTGVLKFVAPDDYEKNQSLIWVEGQKVTRSFKNKDFRHATPLEVKVGHRL